MTLDGCPPRLPITAAEIQAELDRRRPGQSDITTPRKEADVVEILSGVYEGYTTGTPISLLVRNTDQRSSAYSEMKAAFRPSHADYTYQAKFGIRDPNGGGRSSARETIGRVAAGAFAKKSSRRAGSRRAPTSLASTISPRRRRPWLTSLRWRQSRRRQCVVRTRPRLLR